MTDNKGDLISREALKKAIDDYAEKRQDTLLWQADIEELIDNAPTVTPDKIQAIMSDYLVCRLEPKRPQGEWITHITYFECSNCKHCFDYDYAEDIDPVTDLNINYCPNCGADMRGEE